MCMFEKGSSKTQWGDRDWTICESEQSLVRRQGIGYCRNPPEATPVDWIQHQR